MHRISEAEAWATAGEADPPVLAKFEDEAVQAAVTLKRWPAWYVLALHREEDDRLELYRLDDEAAAWAAYEAQVARVRATGVVFPGSSGEGGAGGVSDGSRGPGSR